MKGIRKIILIVITIMIINIMPVWFNEQLRASAGVTEGQPVKIGVFLIDFTDDYISLVRKNLEEIGEKNQENVQFNFFDAKNNQDIQNQDIDKAIKEGIDLALLNIVDRGAAQSVINKFKENNIPVVLFNREPNNMDTIKSYGKALYIGTNPKEAGMLQGKVIVNAWNTNKQFIDKNKDNIIQYVMLMGESDNIEAIERTKYSV